MMLSTPWKDGRFGGAASNRRVARRLVVCNQGFGLAHAPQCVAVQIPVKFGRGDVESIDEPFAPRAPVRDAAVSRVAGACY